MLIMGLEEEIFHIDALAVLVGLCITFFSILTIFYSWGYKRWMRGGGLYYLCILMTWLTSLGAVLANHLIVLLVCWGLTGAFLYLADLYPSGFCN